MLNVSLRDKPSHAWSGRLPRWPFATAACVALVVLAGLALDATIARMGDRIAQAGFRLDPQPVAVAVAGHRLAVPANMIRFAEQRRPGPLDRLDLFVDWPGLRGVDGDTAERFASSAPSIVFVTVTPPNGVRPAIARLETVYRYLFDGPSWTGPDGLVGRRLAAGSAYGKEVLYYEPGSLDPFITRCLDASGDDLLPMCLVEASVDGLSVVYRFNRALLPEWRAIDTRLKALVSGFRTLPSR